MPAHQGPRGGSSGAHGSRRGLTVVVLAEAKAEGRRFLFDEQYWHVATVEQRLTEFGDPRAMSDLRIEKFGPFWELKLKGGLLKRLNVRVYFASVAARREIVILKTYKKEEDRKVYSGLSELLEDRLEDYLAGQARGKSVYRRAREES